MSDYISLNTQPDDAAPDPASHIRGKSASISLSMLHDLAPDEYTIIDIRDEDAYAYDHIPGAVNIPEQELAQKITAFPADKLLILCCTIGTQSASAAERLSADFCRSLPDVSAANTAGRTALSGETLTQSSPSGFIGRRIVSLEGGYYGWLRSRISQGDKALTAQRSIQKTFHKEIWSKFARAVRDYELVQPGDRIAVCMSGGKDSTLMAKLFQELKRHNKMPFDLEFLVMDPGYSPQNREIIERNAKALDIPITVFETNIFESVYHVEKSPCYLCARMRRGYLYRQAQQMGCNKIALGHHYDDVIETVLMGMLYSGQYQGMMPKLHSTNFPGMELIRPMYLIREADIVRWRNFNDLHFLQCACRFTDTCTTCHPESTGSKRMEAKRLIRQLKETNPQVEANIFRSMENVRLETVLGYKDSKGVHSFLDTYDAKEQKPPSC